MNVGRLGKIMCLCVCVCFVFNPLTPNGPYRGRTTPLTSKVAFYIFIQQIYVLNILNMVNTLRFFCSLQNSVCFIILTYLVPVLFTFYIQGVLKLKKNNSGAKRLTSANLPIYFVFFSIYNIMVFTKNVCVIYDGMCQLIEVLCAKCTKSIRHLLYVIVFVLSIFLPQNSLLFIQVMLLQYEKV
jgi:hypothetical protein